MYSVGSGTVGGPIEPQASGPATTVPGPCTVTSDTFQVEASTDDVAVAPTFGTTLTGSSTTATEQVVGVAEGHPFVVVLVRGSGSADQRVAADVGAATDVGDLDHRAGRHRLGRRAGAAAGARCHLAADRDRRATAVQRRRVYPERLRVRC